MAKIKVVPTSQRSLRSYTREREVEETSVQAPSNAKEESFSVEGISEHSVVNNVQSTTNQSIPYKELNPVNNNIRFYNV
jgi:hypothetical protein